MLFANLSIVVSSAYRVNVHLHVFHGYTVCTALPTFPSTHIIIGKIFFPPKTQESLFWPLVFSGLFVFQRAAGINKSEPYN